MIKSQTDLKLKFRVLVDGLIVGIVASIIAIIYRLFLQYAEKFVFWVADIVEKNPIYVVGFFVLLAVLAIVVQKIVDWEPMISGSGIPQVSGEMKGYLNLNWWRVLIAKIVGGTLCIIGGMSLGREGPSVQLGAMAGKGIAKIRKYDKTDEQTLITCGAGAGLAAAFNAPLSGVMFSLEEIHKNFNSFVIISTMAGVAIADFLSKYIFGFSTVFQFEELELFPLRYYWVLVLLGILLGCAGAIYNKVMLSVQAMYKKINGKAKKFKLFIPFFFSGILIIVMPQVLAGGHAMVEILERSNQLLIYLIVLLLVKFLFSAICFGSGAPGGIFFPLLVLGAYVGAIFGTISINVFGMDAGLINTFIILSMAGIFSSIVRAPITGIILIAEMTGTLEHLIALVFVCIISYVFAYAMNSEPIYESLLDRILENIGKKKEEHASSEKVLSSFVVGYGSDAQGKMVKEIQWPEKSLVVSLQRGGEEMIPRGDTNILMGDILYVLCNEENLAIVKEQVTAICESKM